MRLIDAEEAQKVLTEYQHHKTEIQHKALKEAIERVPIVDPVKHGHWINDKGLYKCSICNELWCHWWVNTVPIERMNKMMRFCPNCGAKMEVEDI